jgi:hypothetical protein
MHFGTPRPLEVIGVHSLVSFSMLHVLDLTLDIHHYKRTHSKILCFYIQRFPSMPRTITSHLYPDIFYIETVIAAQCFQCHLNVAKSSRYAIASECMVTHFLRETYFFKPGSNPFLSLAVQPVAHQHNVAFPKRSFR